jgi:hypothetical protein
MILFAVAGILAIVAGADALGYDRDDDGGPGRGEGDGDREVTGLVVLVFGVLLLGCAWMAWVGRTYMPGVLGAVSGIVLIVLFPDTAGVLALLGGILLLAARFVPSRRWA